jgi:hypothetical protein
MAWIAFLLFLLLLRFMERMIPRIRRLYARGGVSAGLFQTTGTPKPRNPNPVNPQRGYYTCFRKQLTLPEKQWNRFNLCAGKLYGRFSHKYDLRGFQDDDPPVFSENMLFFRSPPATDFLILQSLKPILFPKTEFERELLNDYGRYNGVFLYLSSWGFPVDFAFKAFLCLYKYFFPLEITLKSSDEAQEWVPVFFFIEEVCNIRVHETVREDLEKPLIKKA